MLSKLILDPKSKSRDIPECEISNLLRHDEDEEAVLAAQDADQRVGAHQPGHVEVALPSRLVVVHEADERLEKHHDHYYHYHY